MLAITKHIAKLNIFERRNTAASKFIKKETIAFMELAFVGIFLHSFPACIS